MTAETYQFLDVSCSGAAGYGSVGSLPAVVRPRFDVLLVIDLCGKRVKS